MELGCYAHVEAEGILEISVSSSQFFVNLYLFLKSKSEKKTHTKSKSIKPFEEYVCIIRLGRIKKYFTASYFWTTVKRKKSESVSHSIMSKSCHPMNCNPRGSSVHGVYQARILEWVAIPFSGDLPNTGIKPGSPALQADSLLFEPPGKPTIFIAVL